MKKILISLHLIIFSVENRKSNLRSLGCIYRTYFTCKLRNFYKCIPNVIIFLSRKCILSLLLYIYTHNFLFIYEKNEKYACMGYNFANNSLTNFKMLFSLQFSLFFSFIKSCFTSLYSHTTKFIENYL